MKKLHPTQEKLLEHLKNNMDDPLTIRKLQELLDVSSPSVVTHHIKQLEKKGYLKRNPHNPKDYQILTEPEKPVVYLNLYGMAYCGPEGSLLDGDPKNRIPIASRFLSFPAAEAFLVEAKGDSMKPRIREGDFVIAQKTNTANNGETVVCVHKEEVLIKQFFLQEEQIILYSENHAKYPPILAKENDFKIEGVVRGAIQLN